MKTLQQYITEASKSHIVVLTEKKPKDVCCSASLWDDALASFGVGAEVINPAYTDYGGTLQDRAVIELYKNRYSNKIVHEDTSWNGQNALCLLLPGMENEDYFYDVLGLEEQYYKLEKELRDEAAHQFCVDNDCEDLYKQVVDWLYNFGSAQATCIDFSSSDLKKDLQVED